jgi:hypothetical protein
MAETHSSDGLLAGVRVLLVEDETLVAMLLEDMIADLGGTVIGSASRVGRALEMVADPGCAIDWRFWTSISAAKRCFRSPPLWPNGASPSLLDRLRKRRTARSMAEPAYSAEALHAGPGHPCLERALRSAEAMAPL